MIDFTGIKILVVDDQPINIIVVQSLLEKYGATVDTAENGVIGYEKFLNSSTDEYGYIFMDLQMPIMNGYEATKAIRESKHPLAKKISIIAMTADAFLEDVQKSIEVGMNGYIVKPITINAIVKAINNS